MTKLVISPCIFIACCNMELLNRKKGMPVLKRNRSRNSDGTLLEIASPVSGKLVPLQVVGDEMFAHGYLGQGVAIEPSGNMLAAPFDGRVLHIADTGHAILIEHASASGLQLLLHVGINTVELGGKGFHRLVQPSETVSVGQNLLEFDLPLIVQSGYPSYVIAIVIGSQSTTQVICDYREVRVRERSAFQLLIPALAEKGG